MSNLHTPANQQQTSQSVSAQTGGLSTSSQGVSLTAPAYQLQQNNKTPHVGNDQQRMMSVQYNLIAHGFAYNDDLDPTHQTLARAMGFEPNWVQAVRDNDNTGLFAGVLYPAGTNKLDNDFSLESEEAGNENKASAPVMAFRGSETGDQFKLDWYNNDMDPIAVGYTAFMLNYNKIEAVLSKAVEETGERVVVTGHSLGGSLAKQAALHFPHLISACYTYQAPGISGEQQKYLEENMNAQGNINGDQMSAKDRGMLSSRFDDVDTHGFDDIYFEAHTAEGDIVNYAGDGRVPGGNSKRIKHDPSGITGLIPLAHMAMVTSSREYSAEHEELNRRMTAIDPNHTSTTSGLYTASKAPNADGTRTPVTPMGIDNDARNTTDTVHETIEGARDALIAEMFNPHAELIQKFPERITNIPMGSRKIILHSLLNGPGVIESLTKGAGVGLGITALLMAPGTVLGMAGGALAGFSEFGGDSSLGTTASTVGGAVAGGALGAGVDGILNVIPGVGQLKQGVALIAPLAGALGGLAYSYFALSNDINQTQEAALTMLLYSTPEEQKEMIQGVGGATIFYNKMDTIVNGFFGSDVFDRTRGTMTKGGGYFSQLNASEGKEEIEKNLEGGFLGFGDDTQEKLIADVLVYGVVGNDILKELGGGDYNKGLKIVLKKLQGKEDKMVSDKFKFTDGTSRWFW